MRITAQSGAVVAITLSYSCLCVFIELFTHIAAQSGPLLLVILSYSHWSSQWGVNYMFCCQNLESDATKGTYEYSVYSAALMVSPSACCPSLSHSCSLNSLGQHLLNIKHSLLDVFYSCHPTLLACITLWRIIVLLHPSSPLSNPSPRLLSLGFGPPRDATFL